MHEKKPFVPEKYFGPLPGNRRKTPPAASLGGLVPLNLGGLFLVQIDVGFSACEGAGRLASLAGVRMPVLNINSCYTKTRFVSVTLEGGGDGDGLSAWGTPLTGGCTALLSVRGSPSPSEQ